MEGLKFRNSGGGGSGFRLERGTLSVSVVAKYVTVLPQKREFLFDFFVCNVDNSFLIFRGP